MHDPSKKSDFGACVSSRIATVIRGRLELV